MIPKSHPSEWKAVLANIIHQLHEHWRDILRFSSDRVIEIMLSVCILLHFCDEWRMDLNTWAPEACAWFTNSRRFLLSSSKAGLGATVFPPEKWQHSDLQNGFQTVDDKAAAWVWAVIGLSLSVGALELQGCTRRAALLSLKPSLVTQNQKCQSNAWKPRMDHFLPLWRHLQMVLNYYRNVGKQRRFRHSAAFVGLGLSDWFNISSLGIWWGCSFCCVEP